ncbi:MAG TPA: ATP-binding protein [Candidatus Lumbricidophila sp.]|nr:ATP-binding protein [Candidatus Lumbricidophila sp.]
MKRIQRESHRLLRRLARETGLVAAVLIVLCLLYPSDQAGPARWWALVVILGSAALLWWHLLTGSLIVASLAVAGCVLVIALILGEPPVDQARTTAVQLTGGLFSSAIGFALLTRVQVKAVAWIGVGIVAGVLVSGWLRGALFEPSAVVVACGWASVLTIGLGVARGAARAASRIAEAGRAHEAERLASEAEARQRQEARVLHDTVLATLSLLAHSGVGVNPTALRQQASDDARLLRQFRLGGRMHVDTHVGFTPNDETNIGMTFESVRQRFAGMGLDVNWHGAGRLTLPRDTLDALLGAVGECLENVRRHSGVNEADVTVSDDDTMVRAMVTDAGAGFDSTTVDPKRLGFTESVVGRLSSVGGRARVFSTPGAGTTVMLEVPKP